jgi:hypothetical protein
MGLWTALKDPHTAGAVSALSSALQTAGIILAAVGLLMTSCQLRDTRNALRATTALQLQKDGRELFGAMDPDTASYIYAYDSQKKYDPAIVQKAQIRAIQVLNYFASASRQNDYGTIDADLWQSVVREFCGTLTRYEIFRRFWSQAVQNKIYRDNFIAVGQACLQKQGANP